MLKALSNTTRETGESVKLRCEVSGDPPPTRFRWYKNEAPVLEEKGRVVVKKYRSGSSVQGSRLRISDVDVHDTGYYKCEASNGVDRVESTGIVIVRMGKSNLIASFFVCSLFPSPSLLFIVSINFLMQVRQSASLIPFHRLQISSPISRLSVEFQSGITSHFLFGVSRQLAWSRSKIRAMMELVLSVRLLLDMFQTLILD